MKKILVANRGEIALRVMRTCKAMGIATVAVYSEADRNSPHVRFADEAVCVGPPSSKDSYLRIDKIIQVCQDLGVDGVHPGYGFLSENAAFAKACANNGIIFIGPTERAIEIMGSKLAAKQAVSRLGVAIDMPAGPSEVMVCADHTANPDFVASDLLSQAEHGADSQVVLLALEGCPVTAVQEAIERQLRTLPRADIARQALLNSLAIVPKNRREALDLINEYAPEHLILAIEHAEEMAEQIINAGSVFLGNYTPESVGDYASGTNHTLPTNGFARAFSGVSLESFQKNITFQQLSREGLQALGPAVETMAQAEQLEAHRQAVRIRLETK